MRPTTDLESQPTRSAGMSLVEVVAALSVAVIVSLSGTLALLKSVDARQESFSRYVAMNELRNLLATIQDTANADSDYAKLRGIDSVYRAYHGKVLPMAAPMVGELQIICYSNETSVPADLGGPQDLNFDGDAEDDLDNESGGTDLRVVPVEIHARFKDKGREHELVVRRLITRTVH